MVELAFEVNAGACDNYLREYIDPLKFLTCVKGNLVLTSIPLNPDGVDIEGTLSSLNLIADLYYMQGHIHLNQFRARVKSNRSGGEDDLTLALEHFRVKASVIGLLIGRKICYFTPTDGTLGMLSLRHTC